MLYKKKLLGEVVGLVAGMATGPSLAITYLYQ